MTASLFEKVWDEHVVRTASGEHGEDLLYVDLHLVQEVSSPQAFASLRASGRPIRRPDLTLGLADHAVATTPGPPDALSDAQLGALSRNCEEAGITLYSLGHRSQGIVHVVAPELGLVQPGSTIVCGDSHTSTHGAFGALAFGIGTSEVEHVLATQTIWQRRPRTLAVELLGSRPADVSAKDLALHVVSSLGTGGGSGHVIELRGSVVTALSMEERMTLCNMSIEAGARAAMICPDDTTFAYLEGRPNAPTGTVWERAVAHWRALPSDPEAIFDRTVEVDVSALSPLVTWGTSPTQVVAVDGSVPDPEEMPDPETRAAAARALAYLDLVPGTQMRDVPVDVVFIGSCTNSRIEDLRSAAAVLEGRRVHRNVTALVVPGSTAVKEQAEEEGLDRVFLAAGFAWRSSGCSMCVAMNADRLQIGQRCASTSNRNFEGRQGRGGRTHLVSPEVAAATAVAGRFARPSDLDSV